MPRLSILRILGFSTWEHLDVTPMVIHKECYEGEGGGFPQI
jgi:hypothetical protein